MGWGVGLFLHALSVFLVIKGAAIKERMIQKELERESSDK
ncbi:MAG: 2TM domain-containing protein [Planctomycetes bacterium]|nr:2TM domain-containing protein [Planctomycetota bacterium]